jgi:hypothetical protein
MRTRVQDGSLWRLSGTWRHAGVLAGARVTVPGAGPPAGRRPRAAVGQDLPARGPGGLGRARRQTPEARPSLAEPRGRCCGDRRRTGSGRPPDHGGAPEAVGPLRADQASDEAGVGVGPEAGLADGVRRGARHLRVSRRSPRLDEVAPRVLGDHAAHGAHTPTAADASAVAVVPPPSADGVEGAVPDPVPAAPWALPVLWHSGSRPEASRPRPVCGGRVARWAEPAWPPASARRGAA